MARREGEIWRFKYIIHYKLICISYLQLKREPDYKRQKHGVSNIVNCMLLKRTPCLRNHCPESKFGDLEVDSIFLDLYMPSKTVQGVRFIPQHYKYIMYL